MKKNTGNEELNDLITNLLEKESEKRLDWDEYLNHPFFRDKIKIIYEIKNEDDVGMNHIFGGKFVENNKDNLELIINGEKSELVKEYELIKGINNLEIIINNKINNLEYMFHECYNLKNIEELKNLDVKEINNFSYMFFGCISLSDIKSLENWNVSNGNNFSYMFCECSSLSDIKSLQNWNVLNGNNFSCMFYECSSLSDIK